MLNWLGKFKQANKPVRESRESIFDQYELRRPDHQNAIDALPGWSSAFPGHLQLQAGNHPLFADSRIAWALEQFGAIEGKTILEVGPLEGMHTFMLNAQRPLRIDAVEANRLCYLRCLVSRQILDIDRARFLLGDIQAWLSAGEVDVYDLAIASGVLYHMADPAGFLQQVSAKAGALYLWTHYFDETAMPADDVRRLPFSGKVEIKSVGDTTVRYYERSYNHANSHPSFCGGMKDRHFWLHRDDILLLLSKFGYDEILIQVDEPDHSGGPCFSLLARRR
ncbi:class I SAM-dependent methyltransferase [Ensifer sp. 22521]|uniref:class I SAM-dependent methyltransferase n=1 Tax=Ensifer sp. 22521 TaxID=3453935 RepID=UPI003F863753